MLEPILALVVLFGILWAAVYSGTKAALREFYAEIEDDIAPKEEEE
ncbi:hypothetical protein [Natronobacterium texcoconense]|uniref:Uncharacterized protein n=1 Tax=Natronobacterium texcoconense TaxID=1095778 RepID=A0A1H1BRQ2_NATTX|nr:hypothetical protein [Natronobacterium texcoconense]SDQ54573.1 hypothetical protein SAMN04489842_1128 [Natronobacterium texcoconense]